MSQRAVLDTNIVLDWLLFEDPRVDSIRDDIAAGRLVALRHALATDELGRVLAYPGLKIDEQRRGEILERYSSTTTQLDSKFDLTRDRLELPNDFPRCRDAADQFLLALAYHGKADLLITHDKQVLKLAKRAAGFGIKIVSAKNYSAV